MLKQSERVQAKRVVIRSRSKKDEFNSLTGANFFNELHSRANPEESPADKKAKTTIKRSVNTNPRRRRNPATIP